jgi:hypothetical protein
MVLVEEACVIGAVSVEKACVTGAVSVEEACATGVVDDVAVAVGIIVGTVVAVVGTVVGACTDSEVLTRIRLRISVGGSPAVSSGSSIGSPASAIGNSRIETHAGFGLGAFSHSCRRLLHSML